jgi:hypothetical protein
VLWDLFQHYQIGRLDQKLDRINEDVAAGEASVRAATQLNEKVDRLALLCRAMFELMQQTSGITEDQLKAKVVEIDLRDGQADGRVTPKPKQCPKCSAMISPHFGRCLFCGWRDESSARFGS